MEAEDELVASIAPPTIRSWLVENVNNGEVELSKRARLAIEYQRLSQLRLTFRLRPRMAPRELPWHTSAREGHLKIRMQSMEFIEKLFADLGGSYQQPSNWALRFDESPSFEISGEPPVASSEHPACRNNDFAFLADLANFTRQILGMDMYIDRLELGAGGRVHWSCLRPRAGVPASKARAMTYSALAPLFGWSGDPLDLYAEREEALDSFDLHMQSFEEPL